MRTVTPTLATLVAAVLIGCPSSQPPASDAGTTPVAPEAAVVDEAPTAVPTADPAAPDWAGLHGHMKDHMIQLDRARQALVNGDLTGAKVSYAWLGGHTPVAGLPPGWLPHVEAMQGAAAQGEVAW